jgi:hypothetical protein
MGMNHDWGYSTRHFLALKQSYGTSADLKQLIDECHRRQIRVIIDSVFNHTSTDCPKGGKAEFLIAQIALIGNDLFDSNQLFPLDYNLV